MLRFLAPQSSALAHVFLVTEMCSREGDQLCCQPERPAFRCPLFGWGKLSSLLVLLRGRKKRVWEREQYYTSSYSSSKPTEAAVEIFAASSTASSLKLGLPLWTCTGPALVSRGPLRLRESCQKEPLTNISQSQKRGTYRTRNKAETKADGKEPSPLNFSGNTKAIKTKILFCEGPKKKKTLDSLTGVSLSLAPCQKWPPWFCDLPFLIAGCLLIP